MTDPIAESTRHKQRRTRTRKPSDKVKIIAGINKDRKPRRKPKPQGASQ